MRRDILRLATRSLVLGLPLMVVVATYVALDPFKVLYSYDRYYAPGPSFGTNRERISLEAYLRHDPRERFDSFIVGNSRSLAFLCDDWRPHIGEARPFHFDAAAETLFGILTKLRYLDRRGAAMKHVLMVVDASVLGTAGNSGGLLFIKDPRLSGQNRAAYHLTFVRACVADEFLLKYLDYRLTGRYKPWMKDVADLVYRRQCLPTNDLIFESQEAAIREQGDDYWKDTAIFYPRTSAATLPSPWVISSRQRQLLEEIRAIFDRHATDYRIVISPLYNQKPLNQRDLGELRSIFDPARVFDFSGKSPATQDKTNYYEASHYRPRVAREILERIYARGEGRANLSGPLGSPARR